MSVLEEVYASAGNDIIIRTLELSCDAWPESVYICNGFKDYTAVTEDGRTLTFIGANIEINLAKKNNKGNQTLAFSIDNTSGQVQRYVDLAVDSDELITATYRTYLLSNLAAPAEPPYIFTVTGGTLQGNSAQLQCGFFNLIGMAWPRDIYTVTFAPGLRYL